MIIFKKDFTIFSIPPGLYFSKTTLYLISVQLKMINMDYASRYLKIKNLLYNIKFLFEFNSTEFNSTSNHYSDYTYEKYL